MKKILRNLILLMSIPALLVNSAVASDRVDNILEEDGVQTVRGLSKKVEAIKYQQRELRKIEKNLKETRKGQNVYLNFTTLAGSVLVIGIVIGSYKAYIPPGMRAMIGAYVTVTGIKRGVIKLGEDEVAGLLEQIEIMQVRLQQHKNTLNKQIEYYCETIVYHQVCSR